ncbi:hypothetical protein Srubr_38920 [Streptomyces rubradiris]|uniref:Uncharacterized protein n=1 Tax=Streptomyces rubradiris TaxID=285531 RepID=A0ABQ3RDW7_STRRR|nr:hypothetical protein GCM10018792_71780 [Streptomyces rubradiris]GHI54046.1 hypothetical protein Srubr_38920 [Streptomyces rubradiris]
MRTAEDHRHPPGTALRLLPLRLLGHRRRAGTRGRRPGRAANETTVTGWDRVSKQPLFKAAVAGLRLVERGGGTSAPAPTTTASARRHRGPPPEGGTVNGVNLTPWESSTTVRSNWQGS